MKKRITIKNCIQAAILVAMVLALLGYGYKKDRMQEKVLQVMQTGEMCTVKNPRVNFVENPVGINEEPVYFSWEPGKEQTAYEIIVSNASTGEEVWNSGIVTSDKTTNIPYEGKALSDCTEYDYRIFVFDEEGNITQSEKAYFETAYMTGDPFDGARMISMAPEENIYEGGQAIYFKEFQLENQLENQSEKEIEKATFYGSALGVYDAYINGHRIGNDEWKPGWTDYADTLLYNTYDITEYIQENDTNTIAAMVGTGWWCGRNGFGTYGYNQPALICRIVLSYTDGTRQIISSGEDWQYYKDTAVQAADFFNGEIYDASKLTTEQISQGAALPGEGIKDVHISEDFTGEYKSFYGYNVSHLPQRDCQVVSLRIYDSQWQEKEVSHGFPLELKAGETLIADLGQNMTGVPYVAYEAEEGTEIQIQFAEMLNDTGEEERGNDGPEGSLYRANYRSAQTTVRLLAGDNEKGSVPQEYSPTFFYCGFRYLSLTATEDITLHDLKGCFIGSTSPETGEIVTDNEKLNQLFSNVCWSQYNNFSLVATDCPQRDERIGWTGDLLSFAPTSLYNQDLYSFYKKWQEDVMDAQTEEGAFTDTVPATITTASGNAGWADAGILVPLEIYRKYGDKELLAQNYSSMGKYMEYLESISSYVPEDIRMGPAPTFGDWLAVQQTDANLLSALWYLADARAMEKIAGILGYGADEKKYHKLSDRMNEYVLETYKDKFASASFSQTEILFLLNYLEMDANREQILKEALKQNLEENDYKVMTGFAGTPLLLQTLTDCGMEQEAYKVLLGEENPSWLYSVNQGATTIWERWDSYTLEKGFGKASMNSFNHFNEGSVAQWMYESMLGIRVDMTGEQAITIAPVIPEDEFELNKVSGSYHSVYGEIKLAWEKLSEGKIKVSLELPYNTQARVSLPIEGVEEVILPGGTYEWEGKVNTKYLE